MRKVPAGVGPKYPQVVVLMGATGDLSRRKLLPGLFQLSRAGFIPGCRIIGVARDDIDMDGFRTIAREALHQFSTRGISETEWVAFAETLDYVPLAAGAGALLAAVEKAELTLGRETRRVHYLSVPPSAALSFSTRSTPAGPNTILAMKPKPCFATRASTTYGCITGMAIPGPSADRNSVHIAGVRCYPPWIPALVPSALVPLLSSNRFHECN